MRNRLIILFSFFALAICCQAQNTTVKAPTKNTKTTVISKTTKNGRQSGTRRTPSVKIRQHSGYTTYIIGGVSFDMVYVNGGTFMMGANINDYSGTTPKPCHQVTLSNYYIGKTEVTQNLWNVVMGKNPSKFNGYNMPVGNVSWNDCQKFINKLNSLTGETFSLPTEAQWEYAARGGNKSCGYKYSGSNNIGDVAWYYDNCGHEPHTVGTKHPNELGLYDMIGNVSEWCSDWFDSYSASSQNDPTGAPFGTSRVCRGGHWDQGFSVYSRDRNVPGYTYYYYGLRLSICYNR